MSAAEPIVLAISTAQERGAVALLRGDEPLFERLFPEGERGGTALTPAVSEALAVAPDRRVDLVATALGPGSFTGARIGLSFASLFAFGRGAPLIGVCDLEAIALTEAADGEIVACGIVAHDGAVFGATYAGVAGAEPRAISAPAVVSAETFAAAAAAAGARVALSPPVVVSAVAIGRAAVRRFRRKGVGDDVVGLEPTYLRPASPERKGAG